MTLPTTSFALLGLLRSKSMSGYDLAALADQTIAHFWPVPRSQLYRELGRLEELGLLAGTAVAQRDAPDKRLFELTEQGRAALQAWLDEPTFQHERPKNGLLVKLFFARHMAPGRLRELLAGYRAETELRLSHLQTISDRLADMPEAAYQRATARYGVRRAQAALAWLDEVEALLDTEVTTAATLQESTP
ncbi:MAG: PadR family transcriptional regulator [Egibacteraceae bacterium]